MKEERFCEFRRRKRKRQRKAKGKSFFKRPREPKIKSFFEEQRKRIGRRRFEDQRVEEVNECQPFSEIPSALLCEILGRLPIKACLTCKLVCKEWYHVVIGPEFSSFRRHRTSSRFSILLYDSSGADVGHNFNLIELEKRFDFNVKGKRFVGVADFFRFKQKIDRSSKIWHLKSHCNGVVCFARGKVDFFVCHLLAGQCVKLQNLDQVRNLSLYIPRCQLGCCPVSGQFKVLLLFWDAKMKIQLAKIQTLGDGEWRSVGYAPLKIMMDGCLLNGSSHWPDHSYIWSFDFGKEEFSQISLPNDVNNGSHKKANRNLSAFNSCLCLSCSPRDSSRGEIDIWVMQEYGVKESWVKQFVIVGGSWSVPVMQLDKGMILVRTGDNLYVYDPQTKLSDAVEFQQNGALSCGDNVVLSVGFDVSFSRF
ncbi:unnamed protein product [Cuscuta campestris]|uniref:F-box domain-containing protein n=1 Tax=Cuscuta campestris TaxID=132261 RepID=A0A484KKF5_9ASTE|nr:unnamed protein product [Cuscuta campestris]